VETTSNTVISITFLIYRTPQLKTKTQIKKNLGNVIFVISLIASYIGILNLAGNFNEEVTDNWMQLTGISLFQDLVVYQSIKTFLTIFIKCILAKAATADSVCEEVLKMLIGIFLIA
jgi:hypothetical protein